MNILKALNTPVNARVRSPTIPGGVAPVALGIGGGMIPHDAEKLSVVFACLDIRSDDFGSLPNYINNSRTKERNPDHAILRLLNIRPNVRMTPFTRRKLLSYSIDTTGNAYDWIFRDPVSAEPIELIPLTGELVQRLVDKEGNLWYRVTNPVTGDSMILPQEDICDYKGPTRDGINGMSRLEYAREVTASGLAAQQYNRSFYENGGQPSGVLTVDSDLTGFEYDAEGHPTGRTVKDVLHEEWEKYHSGAKNAYRVAILDRGLKYQSLSITQKDAMFIEQQSQTVEDIARYFKMPLYKLQHGKQSYNSNEQNSIEYVGSLRPEVIQREQEMTWKLLTPSEVAAGWEIGTNMMALLRSDSAARISWYRGMKEVGAFSPNDIRGLEDLPGIEGGDEYSASLNYVPLKLWPQLSLKRNGGNTNEP